MSALIPCLFPGMSAASAQSQDVLPLGVHGGDSATYLVITSQGDSTFPAANDTITFKVLDIGVREIYDKTNQKLLSYEIALNDVSLNGQGGFESFRVQYALYSLIYVGGFEAFLRATEFPFYPVSQEFWRVMSAYYCPGLKISHSKGALVVSEEVFYHYFWNVNGSRYEEYLHAFLKIDIDERNGVMLRCEETLIESHNSNTSIVISFAGGSIGFSPAVLFSLVPIGLGVPILLVASRFYHPRRRARGMRKSEILGRFDDTTLLKLARTVRGISVHGRTDRSKLIKLVSESLSIEEIRGRLKKL